MTLSDVDLIFFLVPSDVKGCPHKCLSRCHGVGIIQQGHLHVNIVNSSVEIVPLGCGQEIPAPLESSPFRFEVVKLVFSS